MSFSFDKIRECIEKCINHAQFIVKMSVFKRSELEFVFYAAVVVGFCPNKVASLLHVYACLTEYNRSITNA